jgi:hypothetical protein
MEIKLKSHDSISHHSEAKIGEKRYVLYNGRIVLAEILELTYSLATVKIFDGITVKTFLNSIYRELPND